SLSQDPPASFYSRGERAAGRADTDEREPTQPCDDPARVALCRTLTMTSPTTSTCPNCGGAVLSGDRFCGNCGTPIGPAGSSAQAGPTAPISPPLEEGARRVVRLAPRA